jgi:hypothetical protein
MKLWTRGTVADRADNNEVLVYSFESALAIDTVNSLNVLLNFNYKKTDEGKKRQEIILSNDANWLVSFNKSVTAVKKKKRKLDGQINKETSLFVILWR